MLGGSGLEELLVHLGTERSTGRQRPAHKLLGHVAGEGATCFQALGPQAQSICRGRRTEGLCLGPCLSCSVSSVSPTTPQGELDPLPSNSPSRKGSVVLVWVVVMPLYSPGSECWKSPAWLPSCGKGPGMGRRASQK